MEASAFQLSCSSLFFASSPRPEMASINACASARLYPSRREELSLETTIWYRAIFPCICEVAWPPSMELVLVGEVCDEVEAPKLERETSMSASRVDVEALVG